MKPLEVNAIVKNENSFTYHIEDSPIDKWHYHNELELILILKGAGKCMVGDYIGRFQENELFLFGPNLPHELLCDKSYYNAENSFLGQSIIINFKEDFLGKEFFNLPENKKLLKIINDSAQGCRFNKVISNNVAILMKSMQEMDVEQRFYCLIDVFKELSLSNEYSLLASPRFSENFQSNHSNSLKNVVSFIMQNFHNKILLKDMLELANMSSTTFSVIFKKTFQITFSEFLLKVRIDFACSQLTDNRFSISQISNNAGFENLSNFNRLFKKVKGMTPKDYKKKAFEEKRKTDFY